MGLLFISRNKLKITAMAKTSKRIKSTKEFNNGLSFNDKKAIKLANMVKGLSEEELLQCGRPSMEDFEIL